MPRINHRSRILLQFRDDRAKRKRGEKRKKVAKNDARHCATLRCRRVRIARVSASRAECLKKKKSSANTNLDERARKASFYAEFGVRAKTISRYVCRAAGAPSRETSRLVDRSDLFHAKCGRRARADVYPRVCPGRASLPTILDGIFARARSRANHADFSPYVYVRPNE